MIAIKFFRIVLAMFLALGVLVMLTGAQFLAPLNPYALARRTASADTTSPAVDDRYHTFPERDLGQPFFTIPPIHSVSSATTTVTTVPVLSGSGIFGITATPTLTETASAACSAVYHNPGQGLALLPCFSRATNISVPHIYGSSGMVSAPVQVRTVTTTQVKSITKTRTVTLILSEVTPSSASSASSQALETVTAMCLWADQAVLTPCTTVVAASSKPTSAAAANPLAAVAGVYFLGVVAVGALLG